MTRGRPKKVVVTQGVEATTTEEKPSKTVVETVKVSKKKVEEVEFKRGNTFLIYYNGRPRYMSPQQYKIAAQQGNATLEVPNGSTFEAPANSKCTNCG